MKEVRAYIKECFSRLTPKLNEYITETRFKSVPMAQIESVYVLEAPSRIDTNLLSYASEDSGDYVISFCRKQKKGALQPVKDEALELAYRFRKEFLSLNGYAQTNISLISPVSIELTGLEDNEDIIETKITLKITTINQL